MSHWWSCMLGSGCEMRIFNLSAYGTWTTCQLNEIQRTKLMFMYIVLSVDYEGKGRDHWACNNYSTCNPMWGGVTHVMIVACPSPVLAFILPLFLIQSLLSLPSYCRCLAPLSLHPWKCFYSLQMHTQSASKRHSMCEQHAEPLLM